MRNKYYDTPRSFVAVWQAPLIPGDGIGFSFHSLFEKTKNFKFNISKIKTLAINYFNLTAKVFFYGKITLLPLEQDNQGVNLTCPKSEERLYGYEVEKRICPRWSQFSRRVNGGYIYGEQRPED